MGKKPKSTEMNNSDSDRLEKKIAETRITGDGKYLDRPWRKLIQQLAEIFKQKGRSKEETFLKML